MDDAKPKSDTPLKELELNESFDEQKSQVDTWEEDMRKEREERSGEQSGA